MFYTTPPSNSFTVFENHRKSLSQHCERSELRLQKFVKNVQIVKKDIWELFVMIKSAARMANFYAFFFKFSNTVLFALYSARLFKTKIGNFIFSKLSRNS